ncbi:MAG: phage antirepressor KilAC domain-containing protein [Eubacterium sp.]|nr:phage antirepressor KilAC domain-containing protein [Eubacterium sp.]
MDGLITIRGVRGRINENGAAELNLEDVARGLGFTQTKNNTEYIRWETVGSYLRDFGFSRLVEKDMFIPENIFYKLCFKAKNETAQAFQDKVTDEVLPSIRKQGFYMTAEKAEEIINDPDAWIKVLIALKEERAAKEKLQLEIHRNKSKVMFADSVSVSDSTILIGELSKILRSNGIEIGQNRLFEWLRVNGYLIRRKGVDYNVPTQRAMELGLFKIKETAITHSDGHVTVSKTARVTGKGQIYLIDKFKQAYG